VGEELFHKKQELFEIYKYFKDTGVDVAKYTNNIIEYSKVHGQHNKYSIKLVLDFMQDMGLIKKWTLDKELEKEQELEQ